MKQIYKLFLTLLCLAYISSDAQTYVNETYTTGTGSNDYTQNVSLGSINNTTGASASPFYTFYSGLSTTLTAGSIYTLNITSGNFNSNVYAAYIDYNDDGDFLDLDENVFYGTSTAAFQVLSQSFLVPSTITNGVSTRLRVICTYNTTITPSGAFTYGETEDYVINLTNPVSSACSGGQLLTSCSGTIDDGSGSGFVYNNGQNCAWLIQPTNASSIVLNFSMFQTESGYDYVSIYQGVDATGTLLATYSGIYSTSLPASVTAIGGSMYIVFSTDGSQVYDGFTATYSCNTSAGVLCTSGLNPACNTSDYISNVRILTTTLNNSSTCTGTTSSYSSYSPTGSATATLTKGVPYTLSVTSTTNSILSLWIDINQNNIYEANEWLQVSTSSSPNVANTVSFTIPTSIANTGLMYMRIRSRASGSANASTDACTTFGSGETEDYRINAVNPSTSAPNANFTANATTVTVGQIVSFNDLSTNTPTSWFWSFPGGTPSTSTLQNPTVTYNTAGVYNASLTASNGAGSNTYTATNYITVNSSALCTVGLNPACNTSDYIASVVIAGTTLSNATTCTGSTNSYSSFAPSGNTTASLAKGGFYTFNIQSSAVSDISLWIDYNQNQVFEASEHTQIALNSSAFVVNAVGVSIPTSALSGLTYFRVRTRAAGSGNGPTNACTVFGSGETEDYRITITGATSTCTSGLNPACNASDYISNVSITGTTLNNFSTCNGTTDSYSSYSPLGTATATIVKNTNYTLNVTSITSSIISCWIDVNQNGFYESTEWFQVTASSTGGFASSIIFAIPSTVTNTGLMNMRIRSRASGNPNGNTDACTVFGSGETEDYQINVVNATSSPIANFSANFTSISVGGSTNFTDLSSGNPTSWSWTFTGGTPSTSTVQNPTNIVYNSPGCYQVSLTATNAFGSNTSTTVCYINVLPTGQQYCIPNPTGGTTGGDYINAVSLGTINNLNSGSLTGPSYSYINSQITTLNGGSSYSLNVTNGTYAGNFIAAWIDYNGDGDFSDAGEKLGQLTASTANTTYLINFTVPLTANSGNLIMRVRIADNTGGIANMDACTDYGWGETEDYIVEIVQLAPPVANFSANTFNISVGQSVTFSDQSTNNPTAWFWSFPGATTTSSTLQNPTITYNTAGCYTVTLTASNAYGSDTYTFSCYINVTSSTSYCVTNLHSIDCSVGNSIDDFSITNTTLNNQNTGCNSGSENGYSLWVPSGSTTATLVKGSIYAFNVTTQSSSIISVWIDYNHDGTFGTNEWTQIALNSTANIISSANILIPNTALTGPTRMRLRSRAAGSANAASDPCTLFGSGETEDYTITIVNSSTIAPVANFTASATTIQVGQSISFTDLSSNSPTSWSWVISGGTPSSSTTQNPTNITFNTAGVYSISLTATNSAGSNTVTYTNYITVLANVPCVTGIGGFCGSSTINSFTITSTTMQNTNSGCNTIGSDAYTSYPPTGSTTATLNKGQAYTFNVTCSNLSIISVWIDYNHDGTFGSSEHTQITLSGGNLTAASASILIPNTALTGSTLMRVRSRNSGNQNGSGDACLNFGSGECEDYTITIAAPNVIPVASFQYSPTTVCIGTSVQFTNTSTNATSYSWTFVGGTPSTSTLQNPTVIWSTSGAKTVTLVATNASGSNTATQTITVNANPTANAGSDVSTCNGSSTTLSASGGVSYSWTPTTGLSNPNIASPVATPTTTTTYTVLVTNASGCSATDVMTVTANTVTVAAGADVTICPGGSTQLVAQGPSASSYIWSPTTGLSSAGSAITTASPTSTTTYTVTCTKNGCSATDQVTVSVGSIIANAGSDATICSGNSTQLSASGGTTYQWSPSTGLSNPTIASPVASPISTTTYTVTVSNGSCSSTDQVTVTVNAKPVANAGSDAIICSGASAQIGSSSVSGLTYAWSPSTGLSSATISNPIANPSTSTFYAVTVTNSFGCSSTDNMVVTVNITPTVNLGSDVAICAGGSTTLNASNQGATFSWTPSTGLSSTNSQIVTASPTSSTTYIVTVTNSNGCSASDNISVAVNSVSANAGQDVTICSGSSTVLTASGGATYTWSPSTGLNTTSGSSVTANPAQTTTYTVTATNNGCTATDNIIVNVNSVNASAGADVSICSGASTQLLASGGTSYSWSPSTGLNSTSVSNPIASPSSTTTYTVTVTNGTCTATDNVTVTVNNINANAGNDANICLGSSAQLSATGGTSYSWSPSSGLSSSTIANPVATPSTTTTYIVTVSNNGCSGTAQVTVNVNTATANAGNDVTICTGNSVQLTATGGVSYSWSPSTGLSNANASNPIASPSITTTYLVTATSGNCVTTDFVTVNVANTLTVNAGADATLCSGQTLQLAASGGAQYSWSPASGLSNANIGNPIASPSATTTYTVTTFSGSCSSTDQITITVVPGITANAGSDITLCNGQSQSLIASGGTTYTWTPSTGLSSSTGSSVNCFANVTTTYVVTATTGGCSDMDTIVVNVGSANANAGIDISLCSGQNTTLNASGGTQYSWSPTTGLSNPNISSPVATPGSTTTYTVTVTNGSCTATDNVTISVGNVSVNAGQDIQICNGSSTNLNAQASGALTYSWTPTIGISNPSISNPSASPTTTTLYTVTISDGLCTASDNVNIVVNSNPAIPTITANGNGLTTNNAVSYQWLLNGSPIPNATTQQYTPSNNGSYSVIVTNGSGCTAVSNVFNVITVSIEDNADVNTISVYPNPVSEILNIEFSRLNENTKIEISDVQGRLVLVDVINLEHSTFNIHHLTPGIYFVRITSDNKNIVKRIMKQ